MTFRSTTKGFGLALALSSTIIGCGSSGDEGGDSGECLANCLNDGIARNLCDNVCGGPGGPSGGGGSGGGGPTPAGGPPDPFRYEPETRIDFDNVRDSSFGDLQVLPTLPEPPKSGFRLIMKPQIVRPGDDLNECNSWPIPDVTNRWVYTAVVHVTPGLHHANLYGVNAAPEPYPECNVSADLRMFSQVGVVKSSPETVVSCTDPDCTPSVHNPACDINTCDFNGFLTIPVVLFANSTQVIGSENFAFADGYAYEVPQGIEVVTDTHLQNTTPDDLRVEAAWDFYTMPADRVTNPTAMFVWFWLGFMLPARSEKALGTECAWGGGEIVAVMPHTHQWATRFVTSFGNSPMGALGREPAPGTFTETLPVYDHVGTGLADSDIELYYPPVDTPGTDTIHFRCEYNNTTSHPMRFGVGENEMCFLFGYVSPVEGQRVGTVSEGSPCETLDPHNFLNNQGLIEQLP